MRDQDIRAERWASLGALARQAAAETLDAESQARGRAFVVAAASSHQRPPKAGFRWLAAAAALSLVVIAGATFGYWRLAPLRYEVRGGEHSAANYVGAGALAPALVTFSDGSEVNVRPDSRLRIDATTRDGASVILERGTARAHVRHHELSQWVFAAGPFNVRVIGTRFDLDWDPDAQVVDLVLHEGAVVVESPVGQSHCTVRAGQRFVASLRTGTMTLESIQAHHAPTVGAANVPSSPANESTDVAAAGGTRSVVTPARVPQAVARAARAHATTDSWTKLVRSGDFEAVVRQALAGDLAAILRSCSAADARALADAARYTGRVSLAERVLTAIRTRFPDTDHAEVAGFLLGRTNESSGMPRQADRWYALYLDEAPAGKYVADAMAGRMRVLLAMGEPDAARPIAREYMRRFPSGVHLAMARRLSGTH